MNTYYNRKDCKHLQAYRARYPVHVAALLWCGVPPDDVQEELNRISPHPHHRGDSRIHSFRVLKCDAESFMMQSKAKRWRHRVKPGK